MTNLSEKSTTRHLCKIGFLGILIVISSAATCAEVGTPIREDSCVVDSECTPGDICVQGECQQPCVEDGDCDLGVCRAVVRVDEDDVVDICVDDDVNGLAGECRFDADCEEAFPGVAAQCSADGTCFIPAFSLLIRDTTAHPGVDDGGPGADIAAVFLFDENDEPVAWADALEVGAVGDGPQNPPDGARRQLAVDDDLCVDGGYAESVTALGGDGGTMLVRFLETVTGEVVSSPPASWNIRIVEWGANCPGGEVGEPDSFSVFACAAATHKSTNPDRDCLDPVGQAPTGGVFTRLGEQK